MSAMTVMPPGEWTVADLDRLPDDGLQYELLDGILLVSPSPTVGHQRVVAALARELDRACPSELEVLFAPLDWRPHDRTSLQPDLLVCRALGEVETLPPDAVLLAVEVLSPSTRRKDRLTKASAYADGGIPHYWVVDPARPSVETFVLDGGSYRADGAAGQDEELRPERPFPVTLVPARLCRHPGPGPAPGR